MIEKCREAYTISACTIPVLDILVFTTICLVFLLRSSSFNRRRRISSVKKKKITNKTWLFCHIAIKLVINKNPVNNCWDGNVSDKLYANTLKK